jgi:cephalosporin hydroxylase
LKHNDPPIVNEFEARNREMIARMGKDSSLRQSSFDWLAQSAQYEYTYHFEWLGLPVIQLPGDIVAAQEVIYKVKPDLIIETGIARGGSLTFSASMLALLDYADAVQRNEVLDPAKPKRRVIGIDIDIRSHNRSALDAHPMRSRIDLIEGSSVAPEIVAKVRDMAAGYSRVMVVLDSNHTHQHVIGELNAYAPLVAVESYCIVFDTAIEDMQAGSFPDRPWDKGNNPKTAVWEFLKTHPEFEIDHTIHDKLQITVAPDGYLRRMV